jgi:ABC-type lipoprotein export system ATPase subunit
MSLLAAFGAAAHAPAPAAPAAALAAATAAVVVPAITHIPSAAQRVVIWAPCVAFAFAYALFFLALAFSTWNPKAWSDARAFVLGCLSLGCRDGGAGGKGTAGGAAGSPAGSVGERLAGAAGGKGAAARDSARLLQAAKPVVLTWEDLGCAYNSPSGLQPVLQVSPQTPLRRVGLRLAAARPTVLTAVHRSMTSLHAPPPPFSNRPHPHPLPTPEKLSNQDVSGEARPREMLALMGPSGAGKSTLLDMLAARKTLGRLTGLVRVNGAVRGAGFRNISSYVPQEDNLTPQLSVVETCRMHCAFTLPRGTPAAAAAARTDEVLVAMGINHARDRLVGGVLPGGLLLRGLSGGERKRLWVAVGILATPSVVFLDGERLVASCYWAGCFFSGLLRDGWCCL